MSLDWNSCHVDIWFMVAKHLRPEDTITFAQICRKTHFVTNSEVFWRNMFNRYIRSKYPWIDVPSSLPGSSIRDETIKELFRSYQPFIKRKRDPDSYDSIINKTCVKITHVFEEKTNIRSYCFKMKSRFTFTNRLPQQNQHEGCQVLLVRTKHFVPVPYETENLRVKSITKNLSRGFRAYKLKIHFCDQFSNLAGEVFIFDPIVSVQLYDWWEPMYDKFINNKS